MAKICKAVLVICAILVSTLLISTSTVDAIGGHQLDWIPRRSTGCQGSIAECLEGEDGDDDEFAMDSEISRRILATNQYISYGALKKNNVPCSRRGASYYNCKPGAQANPYNRGCSSISRCRS